VDEAARSREAVFDGVEELEIWRLVTIGVIGVEPDRLEGVGG